MGNESAAPAAGNAERVQLEKVAAQISRIRPGWSRLMVELCTGIMLAFYSWWWACSHSDHNPGMMIFFGTGCAFGMGCAQVGLFFCDIQLRFRLNSVLYDLVWHGYDDGHLKSAGTGVTGLRGNSP